MGLKKPRGKHAHGAQPLATGEVAAEELALEADNHSEATEAFASVPAAEELPAEAPAEPATAPAAPAEPATAPAEALADMPVEPLPLPSLSYAPASASAPAPATNPDFGYDQEQAPGSLLDGEFVPAAFDGFTMRKKRRAGKAVGITFGVIIGVLLVAYIVGAVVFMGRFLPGTTILGEDVSLLPDDEVAQLIDKGVADYTLDVVGNGFSYRTTAADIELSADASSIVAGMHEELNAWAWPVLLAEGNHDVSGQFAVTYRKANYDAELVRAVTAFNATATPPVDATIVYDEALGKYKVKSEEIGTQYSPQAILAAMADAIAELNPKIALDGSFLVQPNVFSTDERLVSSAEVASAMTTADVTLKMGGQVVSQINGEVLSQFVHMDDDFNVTFDDAAFDEWVTALSNGFDTVGTERTYTRADGKVITIGGGAYGWSTDSSQVKEQVVAAIAEGATVELEIPCEQTAAVYTGPGQRDWGNRYIDVDLSEQYVRFYGDDGSIIWESACISGAPDGKHNTWPGVWYITNKESPSKLIGYTDTGQKEYETTVAFWMAFEGNGIGLHDATWQPSFGGSMYANGYGSHGCVNLPYSAAESLYDICVLGDCVVAHY